MVDLVPDDTAETFLYGDKLQAPALIAEFRKKLKSVCEQLPIAAHTHPLG
jgi:hypothetical protein